MSTRTRFAVAAAAVTALAAGAFAQNTTTAAATVPIKANVAANVVLAPITGVSGTGAEGSVTANTSKDFNITIATGYYPTGSDGSTGGSDGSTGVLLQQSGRVNASAQISRGNVTLNLPMQSYSNAIISLYSISGKRILSGSASASNARLFSTGSNLPAGVYLLAVKGQSGNTFTTRLNHSGDRLNISAAFVGSDKSALYKTAGDDYWQWTVTVSADGYFTETRTIRPEPGMNPLEEFTLKRPTATSKANFTETIGSSSFDMVYIPGGTFTIGCEASSGCPANTKAVEGVRVSNYFIAKTTVTTTLWHAVMGTTCTPSYMCSGAYGSMTWFDAMTFACKLSEKTGRHYRMTTEAEWEYAAKNHLDKLSSLSSTEEWAYNTWSATHMGGTDPLGHGSGSYDQKTRRNAQGTGDNITGRLIRSVEGVGPALRLAISADSDYPPGYVPPCNLHMPEVGPEPENSYRDPRWVTGSDKQWEASGQMAEMGLALNLRVWDDGTARLSTGYGSYMTNTDGQWFTSNNIALVFVSTSRSSGTVSRKKFAYIFLDGSQGSIIADDYTGRIAKRPADNYAKPTISGLKSGKELAAEAGDDYKMWDMANIPDAAKKQDSRLLDGPDTGWFQHNQGSAHHYRKDVDPDEFRFTVNQLGGANATPTILANGKWFTVNNTFLRVTHETGYTCDYLYLITSGGNFYHNSFMAYERGDFRSFTKTANGASVFDQSCRDLCKNEIPKGQGASMYAPGGYMANVGHSTFVPAPCPDGGC